jgi:hypothetical protein
MELEKLSNSGSQLTPRLLCNQGDHCRVDNSPLLVSMLSHTNIVQIQTPYFLKIHFNIILPSTNGSSYESLLFRLSEKKYAYVIYPMRATCLVHLILDLTIITFGE